MITDKMLGLTSKRELPCWESRPFSPDDASQEPAGPEVVLLADTFNTYFEPQVLRDGLALLEFSGRQVIVPASNKSSQRLCCGRTLLSSGLIDEAKQEATRLVNNLSQYLDRGVPIVGMEPSCVFTIKDELTALLPGEKSQKLADHVQMLDEYLLNEQSSGLLKLEFKASGTEKVLLHGHCHQKAFDSVDATVRLMENAGIEVETIHSSCCGMAGSFGYQSENYQVSMEMAELSLLPRVREAGGGERVAASGTSCRHQIQHATKLNAQHPISLLKGRCKI